MRDPSPGSARVISHGRLSAQFSRWPWKHRALTGTVFLTIGSVWFWSNRTTDRSSNRATVEEKLLVDGAHEDDTDGRHNVAAITYQPSAAAAPDLTKLRDKVRKMRQERDAIGEELRSLPAAYQDIIWRAFESRPDLVVIYEEREALDKKLDLELQDPRIRDLASWTVLEKSRLAKQLTQNGTDLANRKAIKDYIESEAGKIRRFYFIHEMDRLLSDPEYSKFAEPWLRQRIKPSELDHAFYSEESGSPTLFYSFRDFNDAVVPKPEVLRGLLDQTNRGEQIATFVEMEEIHLIDSSIPEGVEEQISKLTKLGVGRAVLEHRLQSEIPELQALERRRREMLVEFPKLNSRIREIDNQIRNLRRAAVKQ